MKSLIYELYSKLVIRILKDTSKCPDIKKWERLLEKIPEPKDNIDLAYNKYICRMGNYSWLQKCLFNVGSFGMLIITLPKLLVKHGPIPPVCNNVLLFEKSPIIDYRDVAPQELLAQYDETLFVEKKSVSLGYLCDDAKRKFFRCLLRHPFSFYFNLYVLKDLSIHCQYLTEYRAKDTVAFDNEHHVAGPIVTELYEESGRKYISFMHGEYIKLMIHACMNFSEYYIWHPDYAEMFQKELKSEIQKYIIYTPPKLQKKWNLEAIEPTYTFTYYFGAESPETIKKIAELFKQLNSAGLKCKVRPHPRFVIHIKEVFSSFEDIWIEDCKVVSLHDSLASTKYAVSLVSTVLTEASIEGREVVIDDVSDPEMFLDMQLLRSPSLRIPHVLLSDLIAGIKSEDKCL